MKAIVVHEFGAPEVLKFEETAKPTPGAGQLLVRIRAAGVNPADTYMRSGNYARKPALPYTPGVDGAGVVEAAGAGVTGWKSGDRVYLAGSATGTYAEYATVAATDAYRLPEKISFAQGAAIHIPYATAYRALFQMAHARPNDWVLVHGASGGVGVAAVQFARAAGMRVIGTAGTDRGRELVLREGAHHVIDHSAPDSAARILELTGGRGADVTLEMLANVNLGNDLRMLAPRGRVVVIGSRGEVQVNPRDLMMREGAILAVLLWGVPAEEMAMIHAAIGAGLENGTLRPIVGKELPLAEAPRAHKEVLEPGAYGKIVLVP
ncbi:MAG: NADPH:quinone reductase [Candidatus Acidiferrales bacterium]